MAPDPAHESAPDAFEQEKSSHHQLSPVINGQDFPKRTSSIVDHTLIAKDTMNQPLEAENGEKQATTPTIVIHKDRSSLEPVSKQALHPQRSSSLRKEKVVPAQRPATTHATHVPNSNFLALSTPIPTGSLVDLSADRMRFSNRGSIILLDSDNAKAWGRQSTYGELAAQRSPNRRAFNGRQLGNTASGETAPRAPHAVSNGVARSSRVMSTDEASLSRRIRAMYEKGSDDPFVEPPLVEEEEESSIGMLAPSSAARQLDDQQAGGLSRSLSKPKQKLPHETAGGIEDWENVSGQEVDRYGFIVATKASSRDSKASGGVVDGGAAQGVSTPLLEVSNSPRKRGVLRRMPSRTSTIGTTNKDDDTPRRRASRRSVKPQGSIYSYRSNRSMIGSQSSLRSPLGSRDRKLMVDAADMLTLPAGLSEFGSNGPRSSVAMQHKERERENKWRKMATLRPGSRNGSGMQFDFNTSDPKLISRTWKGIPDRWRATAWFSFLEASAKRRRRCADQDHLLASYRDLQTQDSADDVQIDMDVPRTINRHIMFRRRYRGGQRLLFRVLHALSLYFPEVGYVQGMAALAATLLCYYDEEHTFIMMVRLWELRGLQKLYESGFEGLMNALNEFESEWLRDGLVAKKLEELNIHCTAYGTRWYLTLFNYSIPFPAQLRVWDVFMLLGDPDGSSINGAASTKQWNNASDLDVLHATSAALMDATREIVLDSDFENAMKVLTSWIPIKDEDLLMKVAHAEWKLRKRRPNRLKAS